MQSAYSLAIDGTRDTIVRRARQYKWLVIATSVAGVASLAAALALGSFLPFTAGLAGPAAVNIFLALDLRAVQQWRRAALRSWLDGDLQLDLLARTLRQVPGLPPSTLEGMLETLPDWSFHALAPTARSALAQAQQALDRIALQARVVTSLAWAAAATVAMAAAASGRPLWLLALPAAAVPYLAWRQLARRRLKHQCLDALQAWRSSNTSGTSTLTGPLNWHGVPRPLVAVATAWPEA